MAYFAARLQPFIRAFIISDALLYSALNLVNILFVVYVTTKVPGGTVQSASAAIAIGLTARIVVELAAGRAGSSLPERQKLWLIVGGMAAITISYLGFAVFHNIYVLSGLWVINGAGWAIGHPAKLALVAKHVNHEQSNQEWGVSDALNMTLVVITMGVGAYVVAHFSYGLLFIMAAIINGGGILPYLLYLRSLPRT